MLEKINAYLTPAMVIALLAAGLYLSFGTRFFQFRRLGQALRATVGSLFTRGRRKEAKDGITPFQAVSTALAGTLGTGNIVGVATAIVSGGPGAIFWMIVSAFFGMIIKYAEVLLAVEYQIKDQNGSLRGGPMYYIKNGLHMPKLAALFAVVCLLASFGVGNMVQSHSVSDALHSAFGLSKPLVGLVVAVIVSFAAFSGIKSIAKICEKLVPFMALFYLGACLFVISANAQKLPAGLIADCDICVPFPGSGKRDFRIRGCQCHPFWRDAGHIYQRSRPWLRADRTRQRRGGKSRQTRLVGYF